MKFRELASYLEKLEKTPSRNEMTRILADLFKKADSSEIDKITYLLSGQLAPNYRGIDFNIAERLMFQILAKAYGKEVKDVIRKFKEKGDLGVVAEDLAKTQKSQNSKTPNMTVSEVYDSMMEVAKESGEGSVERKIAKMADLLSKVEPQSARYIARIPVGNLRLGFSDMTILDSLSYMLVGDKSAREKLEAAFNVNCDIGRIAKLAKSGGLKGIKDVDPIPGIPIRPSLAERLPSAEKVFEKVGQQVAVEPKYDGFRCTAHIFTKNGKKQTMLFSRNLENTTEMFPDIAEAVLKIKVNSAIFDGEAIGYNSESGKFLPFQETVSRKRKHGIPEAIKKLPLKLFLFDILHKNGKSLLDLPYQERRKILKDTVSKVDNTVVVTRMDIVDSPSVLRDFVKRYLTEGLEGALIKKIDAPYKAGARGYHWVKYKKTTEGGVADTVDCLVMGVNKGRGKRAGFGIGAFLVGVKDGEKFKTVSKIGTGLSDEQWRELNERTQKLQISKTPREYVVDKNLVPDVWTKPSLVVEILADEITKSPIHSAGLALRFPRLIKFRDEKDPKDATTLKELTGLYKMQKS